MILSHGTEPTDSATLVSRAVVTGEFRRAATSRSGSVILIAILGTASIFYFCFLKSDRFGAYHDDGIYVATARSLADGQGYRILSLPDEPAQTKYPPLYPLILSLIWRVQPAFPDNLTLMMVLSVIAALSFLLLTRRYLVSSEYASPLQALIVVALTALNWRTVILSTSVYSEMLYAALSVGGLQLAEKHLNGKTGRMSGMILGLLIGLAFLTRTSGIALLVALAAYSLLKRQWRKALLPVGIGMVFVLAWAAWCYVNKNASQDLNAPFYTSYFAHLNQVVTDLQAQGGSSRLAVHFGMALENFIGGILVSIPLVCTGLNYQVLARLSEYLPGAGLGILFLIVILVSAGFIRTASKRVRLLHIYLVMSLGLYLFWLPSVSYDRFLMPMLPFLLLFLVCELGMLVSLARKGLQSGEAWGKVSGSFISFILFALIGLTLYGYGSGAYSSFKSLQPSASRAADDAQAISWIKENTASSDSLVCYRDPKYFLYTGHKAVRSFPMTEGYSWEEDQSSMEKLAHAVFRIIDEARARYIVVTATDFELEDRPEQHRKTFDSLIEQHPQNFVLVYESTDRRTRIFRIDGVT